MKAEISSEINKRLSREKKNMSLKELSSQNSHGDVKYSIGNGEAKELTCMTHGREQWWGTA